MDAPAVPNSGRDRRRQRVAQRDLLRPQLQEAAAALDSGQLLVALEGVGVPAGRLQSVARALQDAPDKLLHEGLAGLRSVAFSGFTPVDLRPPPRLGQHSQEVLAEWLPGWS